MRKHHLLMAAVIAILLPTAVPARAAEPDSKPWDGLVEVSSPKMDVAYLMPGTDFRVYKRVMLDNPEVAFQKNWMRTINSRMGHRVSEQDAKKILASVQSNTRAVFEDVFAKAGFAVVAEPGEDVLRVRSAVVDLYVNAPDTNMSAFSRTYTAEAGEATLVLELRDSLTNALLGRVLDRRETRRRPGPSNRVTNEADYRALAGEWARISVKGLESLRAHSPIPDPLAPGQKLN